jgi:hypothetical protein
MNKSDILRVNGRLALAQSELFTKYSPQRGSWSNHIKVIFTDNGTTAVINLATTKVEQFSNSK